MPAEVRGTPRPSDLGRRVAHRRRQLGLSVQELAARTSMAEGCPEDLECWPAYPSRAVLRLAAALDTTADALLGGDVERVPDPGRPAPRPSLDVLFRGDAQPRLATGGVGRLVFHAGADRPVALPVNYQVVDGDIVLPTATDTSLNPAVGQDPVSFEVDQIDEALSQGWSVLVTGGLERVDDHAERSRLSPGSVRPWPGEDRTAMLRVVVSDVSGRRIGAEQ